jgi:hypothetical protein
MTKPSRDFIKNCGTYEVPDDTFGKAREALADLLFMLDELVNDGIPKEMPLS